MGQFEQDLMGKGYNSRGYIKADAPNIISTQAQQKPSALGVSPIQAQAPQPQVRYQEAPALSQYDNWRQQVADYNTAGNFSEAGDSALWGKINTLPENNRAAAQDYFRSGGKDPAPAPVSGIALGNQPRPY